MGGEKVNGIRRSLCFIAIASVLTISASAGTTPYYSYNDSEWSTELASPDTFVPDLVKTGEEIGVGHLKEPTDLCIDRLGQVYVLDKTGGRVLVLDGELELVTIIDRFTLDGAEYLLKEPEGLFVAQDGMLYIADTGNGRALRVTPEGEITQTYEKPETEAYTADGFAPIKLAADGDGMVYIVGRSVYQGIMLYTPDGVFESFYGSPPVQVTVKMLLDRLWKSILSEEIRSKMARYVPVEFSNLSIDDKGFIYTCTYYTNNTEEQLRKLNYLGDNVYPFTGNFGEAENGYGRTTTEYTNFVDVAIEDDCILYGLDSTRGRVYGYNQEGDRLFSFGTRGDLQGAFRRATAMAVHDGNVYVLDFDKGSITKFVPTAYGSLIKEAVRLHADGLYQEAMEPWEQVLEYNCNFEMAYVGMGDAMLKLGNYKEAVSYFRLGQDRERESKAFYYYRSELLRENIYLVIAVVLLLAVALTALTSRKVIGKIRAGWRERGGKRK